MYINTQLSEQVCVHVLDNAWSNAVMCLSVVSRGDGVSSVSVTDGDKSSSCHAMSSLDVTENTCTPRGYFCVLSIYPYILKE